MRILVAFFLLFLGVSGPAYAASFNCSSSKLNKIEKLICSDEITSEYDEELSMWYRLLKNININRQFQFDNSLLRGSQLTWLKDRNSCGNLSCLKNVYVSRITDLKENYLKFKKITSLKFLENIIAKHAIKSEEPISINDVISFSVGLNGISEFLLSTYQSLGIAGPSCGSGAYYGYWFLKVDLSNEKHEVIDKVEYANCGSNVAELSHTIKGGYPTEIKIFRDITFGENPIKIIDYRIYEPRSEMENDYKRIVQKGE
jgi:uncharacterized protein